MFACDDDFVHATPSEGNKLHVEYSPPIYEELGAVFFCQGQIFGKFQPEYMISTYLKDSIQRKVWPNLPDFEESFPNFQIFMRSIAKNINGFCFVSTFISSM
jgi:hypothetical protein